jgi:ribosome-interacting GTPase 1
MGKHKEALRELETLVAQDPKNKAASDRLAFIRREIRLKDKP